MKKSKFYQIKNITEREYTLVDCDGSVITRQIQDVDKSASAFTIKDAKDGDVLHFSDETIVIFKDLYNETTFHSYCHIEDGLFDISKDEMPDWWEGKGFHPATKEQRDLLFQKMREAGYEWDSEKKELKKIELSDVGHEYYSELLKNDTSDNIADYAYQCVYCMSHDWAIENPTWDNVQSACRLGAKWQKKHDVSEDWSEEDEKMIEAAINLAHEYGRHGLWVWLQSLKDRYTWKPSDKQMHAFEQVYDWYNNNFAPSETLTSLYKDLEKLKGE